MDIFREIGQNIDFSHDLPKLCYHTGLSPPMTSNHHDKSKIFNDRVLGKLPLDTRILISFQNSGRDTFVTLEGCLPNFWQEIPWLFPDFFLVFPDSPSSFYSFCYGILPPQIIYFWKLFISWYFFYNIFAQICFPDFLSDFPPTFPRKGEFPDFSLTSPTWQTSCRLVLNYFEQM